MIQNEHVKELRFNETVIESNEDKFRNKLETYLVESRQILDLNFFCKHGIQMDHGCQTCIDNKAVIITPCVKCGKMVTQLIHIRKYWKRSEPQCMSCDDKIIATLFQAVQYNKNGVAFN